MMMKDEQGRLWKTGLKLDYNPKVVNLESNSDYDKEISAFACGRKHYALVNKHNQLLIWGNVLSAKSDVTIDGFNLYYGDSLFEGGKCKNLSMKYGLFGVVVDDTQ